MKYENATVKKVTAQSSNWYSHAPHFCLSSSHLNKSHTVITAFIMRMFIVVSDDGSQMERITSSVLSIILAYATINSTAGEYRVCQLVLQRVRIQG